MWSRTRKGRESATFEYDKAWLEHPERFALEPALTLGPGPKHTEAGKALFGALGDSAPDRWGRVLMQRAERKTAQQQDRAARNSWAAISIAVPDAVIAPSPTTLAVLGMARSV